MRMDTRKMRELLALLKYISEVGPQVVKPARDFWDWIRGRRPEIPVVPPDEERPPSDSQGDEDRIAQCIRALRKHVQVINRNSNVLSEHEHIIEELAKQGKERAEVLDKLWWLVKIALLVSVISLVIAVVAVLVTLL
jgi:hypothetical protein